jgi:hypothetical protein
MAHCGSAGKIRKSLCDKNGTTIAELVKNCALDIARDICQLVNDLSKIKYGTNPFAVD